LLAAPAQAATASEWIVYDHDAIYSDATNWVDYPTQGSDDLGVHYHDPDLSGATATWDLIQNHEGRYKKVLNEIEGGTMFKKDQEVSWECRKCGHVHTGGRSSRKMSFMWTSNCLFRSKEIN